MGCDRSELSSWSKQSRCIIFPKVATLFRKDAAASEMIPGPVVGW